MTDDIETLRRRMEQAAQACDFELAGLLRDRISLLRAAGPGRANDDFDPAGLTRQQPGAMGLGSSQQRVTPPPGWMPPEKPDPMTTGKPRRRRGT